MHMWFSIFHIAATIQCAFYLPSNMAGMNERNEGTEWGEKNIYCLISFIKKKKKTDYGFNQGRENNPSLVLRIYACSWHMYSCSQMLMENSCCCISSGIKLLKCMSISSAIQCYLYRILSSWGFLLFLYANNMRQTYSPPQNKLN